MGSNPLIIADDKSLKKILGQKQPAILLFHEGLDKDKPLKDAITRAAKKHADELLVVSVDVNVNPDAHAQYDKPATPALTTLTKAFFGRKIKSVAENVRPSDVRNHIAHLLEDKPLPENNGSSSNDSNATDKSVVYVLDSNFQKEVLKSKTPVLVDFYADWCGPCKAVAPFVEKMAKEYAGHVKVVKLDTDRNKRTSGKYFIQSIPTFIMFHQGEPVGRLNGANPRRIEELIKETLLLEYDV
jgi:thioredoxin 1